MQGEPGQGRTQMKRRKKRMPAARMIGQRFGSLTVIARHARPHPSGRRKVKVRCDCGAMYVRHPFDVRNQRGLCLACHPRWFGLSKRRALALMINPEMITKRP